MFALTRAPQVIYLLLDVMYSFPNKGGASVESFPTAFALPIGLVKLVQGLWLLDHHDHQVGVIRIHTPTHTQAGTYSYVCTHRHKQAGTYSYVCTHCHTQAGVNLPAALV